MQNLRQLQQTSNIKSLHISSSSLTPNTSNNEMNNTTSLRRGIKVRSPRRTDTISGQTPGVSQNSTQSSNIMPTITPAALVVAKPVDAQHALALSNQSNVQQIMQNVSAATYFYFIYYLNRKCVATRYSNNRSNNRSNNHSNNNHHRL